MHYKCFLVCVCIAFVIFEVVFFCVCVVYKVHNYLGLVCQSLRFSLECECLDYLLFLVYEIATDTVGRQDGAHGL